jgi:hypothetical protein
MATLGKPDNEVSGALLLYDLPSPLSPEASRLTDGEKERLDAIWRESESVLSRFGFRVAKTYHRVLVIPQEFVGDVERTIHEVKNKYASFGFPAIKPKLALVKLNKEELKDVADFVRDVILGCFEFITNDIKTDIKMVREAMAEGNKDRAEFFKDSVRRGLEEWYSICRKAKMLGIELDSQTRQLEELANRVLSLD